MAATDYMRDVRRADPALRAARYRVLGTDGFGRSDYRKKLRHFFEVDRHWVALAALESLARRERCRPARSAEAIKKYGIDPDKPNPAKV